MHYGSHDICHSAQLDHHHVPAASQKVLEPQVSVGGGQWAEQVGRERNGVENVVRTGYVEDSSIGCSNFAILFPHSWP